MTRILAIAESDSTLNSLKEMVSGLYPDLMFLKAGSGFEGFEMARKEKPDLILLEFISHCTDTAAFCCQIREDELLARTPVIALIPSEKSRGLRLQAMESGVDAIVSLPLDPVDCALQFRAMLKIGRVQSGQDQVCSSETTRTPQAEKSIHLKCSTPDKNGAPELREIGRSPQNGEERYRQIFENIQDVYYESALDGTILEVSPSIKKISKGQYDREDLLGESMYRFYANSEDRDAFLSLLTATGSVEDVELPLLNRDGSVLPCSVTASISFDTNGNPLKVIGSMHDITKRKNAESLLHKSEERLRLLAHSLGSISECVTITNTRDQIIYVNDSLLRTYGYEESELIGEKVSILRPAELEHIHVRDILPRLPKGGWRGEIMNRKKDGTLFPVLLSPSVIQDEKGVVIAYIGVAIDVTEMRKNREELIKAKEQAEESNRLRSALLNNMNHEIRTPMNAIIGFSDLMNEAEPEDKNTYAQIISNSGNQLLALIDDVILLSRLQSEKMPLNKVEFKPAELVKEVSLMFGHPDMNKGLDILVNIPKPYKDLNIWADADKIRQILTNLTANAVKYTQTGNIEIGFLMHKEHIEFYTKDTGIGLSEQDATRIFEAFYRSDRALSLAIRGTGLGLNIAKALTEQIGGTINVYSIQDKGSCFYFVIPLEICEKPATHLDEPLNLHKETKDLVVLIAEDEPINFQYLSALLKGNVSRIDHAENGKEAVELASRNIYDLVLMDIKMPVMGGIEATKLLKKRYPDLLIIAQTAYTLPEEKESALDAGCVDFISKPISKAILMEMIHKYC